MYKWGHRPENFPLIFRDLALILCLDILDQHPNLGAEFVALQKTWPKLGLSNCREPHN